MIPPIESDSFRPARCLGSHFCVWVCTLCMCVFVFIHVHACEGDPLVKLPVIWQPWTGRRVWGKAEGERRDASKQSFWGVFSSGEAAQ